MMWLVDACSECLDFSLFEEGFVKIFHYLYGLLGDDVIGFNVICNIMVYV